MDKQIIGYPYSGIPLSYKKEWTIRAHRDMDAFQNNYAEWKKPDRREGILYNSVYLKFRNWELSYSDRNLIISCLGRGMKSSGKRWQEVTKGHQETFLERKDIFIILIVVIVSLYVCVCV